MTSLTKLSEDQPRPRSRLVYNLQTEDEGQESESYYDVMLPMFERFSHAPSWRDMETFILAVMARVIEQGGSRGAIAHVLSRDDVTGASSTYKKWRKFYPGFVTALEYGVSLVSGNVDRAHDMRLREGMAAVQEADEILKLGTLPAARTMVQALGAYTMVYLGNDEETGERIIEQIPDWSNRQRASRDLLDRQQGTARKTGAKAVAVAGAAAAAEAAAEVGISADEWKARREKQIAEAAETVELLGST